MIQLLFVKAHLKAQLSPKMADFNDFKEQQFAGANKVAGIQVQWRRICPSLDGVIVDVNF